MSQRVRCAARDDVRIRRRVIASLDPEIATVAVTDDARAELSLALTHNRHTASLGLSYNTVSILGCVSAAVKPRLGSALPTTTFCEKWPDVETAVRSRDDAVLFLDPLTVDHAAERAIRLRERYPRVTVVIYTSLEPTHLHGVVALAREGFTERVIRGFDDTPERLKRLVDDCVSFSSGRELAMLEPIVSRLPAPLARAVQDMFRRPRCFRSTLDLAAAAGVSSRAVFRQLKAAGFHSPRRLIASARVIRAFHLLSGGGRSGQEVASRLGYRSVDQLSQHFTELAGCTASDVRRGNIAPDLPGRVLRSLTARPQMRPSKEIFAYAD